MSRSSVILRNVASNWIGFAVNAAVTLLLTPFILHHLGTARYGVWILTSSLIGYYGLLDIGFRAGVTQYLTRYLAAGDYERASQCISSAVAGLAVLGGVIFGLSIGASYVAPHLFKVPPDVLAEASWCILIVGCSSAVQFFFEPFSAVFTATQRFDIANGIGIMTRLVSAAGIVTAIRTGGGLVGVSAATCIATMFDYLVRWRVARRLAPRLDVSLRHTSWSRVREISTFGAWNFLIAINAFVYRDGPNILIGSLVAIAAVGHYALSTSLVRYIVSILNPVSGALYPAAIEYQVRGDRPAMERLYHDGSRLMLLAMACVVVPSAFFATDFYRLWIGVKYVSGVPYPSVALIFRILLISVVTNYSSAIAFQILLGAGRVKTLALALICGSVLNLGTSLILIRSYGLVGVALAVVGASVAIDLIAVPLLVQRYVGLSAFGMIRRAWPRPLAVAALQAAGFFVVRQLGAPQNWNQLVRQGAEGGILALIIVVAIGMRRAERQRFLVRPLQRVLGLHRSRATTFEMTLHTPLQRPEAEH